MTEITDLLRRRTASIPGATHPHNALRAASGHVGSPRRAEGRASRAVGPRAQTWGRVQPAGTGGCADRIRSVYWWTLPGIERGPHRRPGTHRPRRCGRDHGRRSTRVAERDGLLGLAGTSQRWPSPRYVAGGVGFLTRPYGMASSALLAVDYVDGNGQIRRAKRTQLTPSIARRCGRFGAGGGVGVATALTVELVAPRSCGLAMPVEHRCAWTGRRRMGERHGADR